jgi:hypothetical protein
MAKRPEPVDITGHRITKLPPGRAKGADDLKEWGQNRNGNLSSVPDGSRSERNLLDWQKQQRDAKKGRRRRRRDLKPIT